MASGTIADSNGGFNSRGRYRLTEYGKVYTRKIFKKARKACNDDDINTTRTSAAPTTPINPTPTCTEVSPVTVAAGAGEVSTSSTSEYPKDHAADSPPPTTRTSPGTTTTPRRTAAGNIEQQSLEAVVTKDDESCQRLREHSPHQEQSISRQSQDRGADSSPRELSLSHGSLGKDGDSSVLQLSQQQLQEQARQQESVPSVENRVHEGSGIQAAELQNLKDSRLPSTNEAQNLRTSSPLDDGNELLHTKGFRPQNLRHSSPVSGEDDLLNGREVAAAQQLIESEALNSREVLPGSPQVPEGNGQVDANGVVKPLVISSFDDRIRINLCKATPKNEIKELRKKLDRELDQVRKVVERLEAKELHLASYNTQISNSNLSNSGNYISAEGTNIGGFGHPQPQRGRSDVIDRRVLLRVNSEAGALVQQETTPVGLARVNSDMGAARNPGPRPFSRQLSVAVMENNHRNGEFVEKEKRTPKANQYYRNSEFLLGKDRLPPESNKRLKTSNGRKLSGVTQPAFSFGFGYDKSKNQVFKRCSSLLQRLMKHKHGWVFNEPVDAEAMGLVDYHDIIKHPMDLGTIKTRLSQNWYKSPREFADDVRLVFHNAMTYNPKGQDVHVMAEQLLQIFEEKWAIIETEYNPYPRYQMYQDGGLPTPTSRRAPSKSQFAAASVPVAVPPPNPVFVPAAPQLSSFDRAMATSMAIDPKIQRPHVGRTPVPKKPKAKDPNKRDMTYEEKQRLSTSLQGLPLEKLDAIIQIIKKRNTALSQNDDEIEVDIDRVDPETLWELDRFVTNYKKSLSKHKRKAELALQARMAANQNVALTNSTPAVAEGQVESGGAFGKSTAPPTEGEKQEYNGSRSSSSSSSSSDSGSSSSDSDSDSSSEDGSDAGQSPRT
ncbi:Transcription initiation factor TFIID, subunit BDF1 [Handroanthus impetiginosus]|uniref:Transcription initiation factor TFIID, subunit BDF1 n=1 Tax=Handroanthus impetiginosus TaxID=429701 RepID=A0A2G9HGZ5_9LAMI|nr:Transcription initiation factor TFIID, subunit BDF1 [Handroanthus impetiginosus]